MNKTPHPHTIGFLQALGVVAYCSLIGLLFWALNSRFINSPQFFTMVFILVLLVLSAAVTGSIVFGYAVYLALNKKIKQALFVLAYTITYGFIFFLVGLIILVFLG